MLTETQARNFFEENAAYCSELTDLPFHTKAVVEIATILAKKMGLNSEEARIAGWLHDIGYRYGAEGHAARSVQMCREAGLELTPDIEDGILNHGQSKNPTTPLGRLMRVADKLCFVAPYLVEFCYPDNKPIIKEMLESAIAVLDL